MNRVAAGNYRIPSYSMKKQQAVTKIDFLRARFLLKTLTIVTMMAVLAIAYVWSRAEIVSVGYAINEYKALQAVLVNDRKLLQMELSLLKSPVRLEKAAKETLGLVPAAPEAAEGVQ